MLPVSSAGAGVAEGNGTGVGAGVGVGEAAGLGEVAGEGDTSGDGDIEGDGEPSGDGVDEGVGDGDGAWPTVVDAPAATKSTAMIAPRTKALTLTPRVTRRFDESGSYRFLQTRAKQPGRNANVHAAKCHA